MPTASPRQPMAKASIVIATHNRREELRRAIASGLSQTVSLEIVVLDDDSYDGTEDMIRKDFPGIVYRRFKGPLGPCHLRNEGSRLASSPIVFPIDDDSMFVARDTVEVTLRDFDNPRVA